MAHLYRLERTQTLAVPRQELFAFFENATNLERITPPYLHFELTSKLPIEIRLGACIDYRLRLHGIPLRWRSRIEVYDVGERFVDLQIAGPYRHWRHLHEFIDVPGGTELRDTVEYALPLGPLGRLARSLFVERQVAAIFDYRKDAVERIFKSS